MGLEHISFVVDAGIQRLMQWRQIFADYVNNRAMDLADRSDLHLALLESRKRFDLGCELVQAVSGTKAVGGTGIVQRGRRGLFIHGHAANRISGHMKLIRRADFAAARA